MESSLPITALCLFNLLPSTLVVTSLLCPAMQNDVWGWAWRFDVLIFQNLILVEG